MIFIVETLHLLSATRCDVFARSACSVSETEYNGSLINNRCGRLVGTRTI